MDIRWPGTVEVDNLYRPGELPDGLASYDRKPDVDVLLCAPRWIAWLYRLLPNHFFDGRSPGFETPPVGTRAPFYLWQIMAPTWSVGWVPARRRPMLGVGYLSVSCFLFGCHWWHLGVSEKFLNGRLRFDAQWRERLQDERGEAWKQGHSAGRREGIEIGREEALEKVEALLDSKLAEHRAST